MISEGAIRELDELRFHDRLEPAAVLERAKNPKSALHGYFTWDDTEAARLYRLDQATHLIVRAKVRIFPCGDDPPRQVRAKVQPTEYGREANAPWLRSEAAAVPDIPAPPATKTAAQSAPSEAIREPRKPNIPQNIPGVRLPVHPEEGVDPRAGSLLMKTALTELVTLRQRYAHLAELGPVFRAIDQLVRPEIARLLPAVRLARELVDHQGLDLQTAADRAAQVHAVRRSEVLVAMREAS